MTLPCDRDVSDLHVRLEDIITRYPRVVFAAHCAEHDWTVLLESIDNRLVDRLDAEDGDVSCTVRLLTCTTTSKIERSCGAFGGEAYPASQNSDSSANYQKAPQAIQGTSRGKIFAPPKPPLRMLMLSVSWSKMSLMP